MEHIELNIPKEILDTIDKAESLIIEKSAEGTFQYGDLVWSVALHFTLSGQVLTALSPNNDFYNVYIHENTFDVYEYDVMNNYWNLLEEHKER